MAYVKRTWSDRVVEFVRRYTDELGAVKTFTPNEGTITNTGTPTSAAYMNNLETGVEEALTGSTIYAASAVGTDSYAVTLTGVITAYTAGLMVRFKADVANTGTATLNVNALGAKAIKKNVSDDLANGDIKVGQIITLVYDGTNFQLLNQTLQKLNKEIYVTPGTYTFTATVSGWYKILVIGGGGSGAFASTGGGMSGGGAGGAAIKWIYLTAGTTVTVTVGAGGAAQTTDRTGGNVGGTSSFGTHCSATGGYGGAYSANAAVPSAPGGTGSSGDLNMTGGPSVGSSNPNYVYFGAGRSILGSYGCGGEAYNVTQSYAGNAGVVLVEWEEVA